MSFMKLRILPGDRPRFPPPDSGFGSAVQKKRRL